jgi:hypothetical protein
MADEQELIKGIRARRAAGIDDLGEEIRQRIRDFGDVQIDSDVRREAFSELTAPFEVAPYRLLVRPESVVVTAEQTVVLRMILVDLVESPPMAVATIERTLALADAQVDHAYLTVSDRYRGRAITPRIMLASFARYDQLGIRTVTVHAGLATGRFYWSGKVGFDFLRDADQRHVERWAAFVLGALNHPIDLEGISQPQQWALLGTTADPPPTARFSDLASAIARVSTVLLDPNGTGIVGSVECGDAEVEPGMVDLPGHLRRISDENGIDWDADVPLGKLIMLSGPDWWGRFDLTDPVGRSAYESSASQAIAKAEKHAGR